MIQKCIRVVRKIEAEIPYYERRITLKTFKETYDFATSKVVLRSMFRDLSQDGSTPLNLSQSEIDQRKDFALLLEDSCIIVFRSNRKIPCK